MNRKMIFSLGCIVVFLSHASESMQLVTQKKGAIYSVQNKRHYQEDRFYQGVVDGGNLYAVYDGHGGADVAQFLAENFHSYFSQATGSVRERMITAFKNADEHEFVKNDKWCGSTATVVFIKNGIAHFAHAGDSRALLQSDDNAVDFATKDHKPTRDDERIRIKNAGGEVCFGRVSGILAVSRAIGDYSIGKQLVISEPEYAERPLTKKNNFLILASDGLWDEMEEGEVAVLLTKYSLDGYELDVIAKKLGEIAIKRGSTDNITVMLVDLLS